RVGAAGGRSGGRVRRHDDLAAVGERRCEVDEVELGLRRGAARTSEGSSTRHRSCSLLDNRTTQSYLGAHMGSMPPPPGSPTPPPPSGSGLPPFPSTPGPMGNMPPPPGHAGTSRGPVPLQPMRVGQTIDAAIKLYRSDWKTLMT